jgi:hypothetical protein
MAEYATQPDAAKESEFVSAASAMRNADHDGWLRAASDPSLTADQALALLDHSDLPGDVIEQLAKNRSALTQRKVKVAVACHAHTPRHVSVPMIRQFYTFDLMKVALSPVVPTDVKVSADETLIARLKTITLGERLTLARRASGRIAGALLSDANERIMHAALENARLTEALIVQAVLKAGAGAALVQATSQHPKWSFRRDVQAALLRTKYLSLARALAFAREISPGRLREILQTSRLPEKIKDQLLYETPGKIAGPSLE